MRVLRGLGLFVAGAVVSLTATTFAQNQTPNRGIVGLNHVGLSVPDLDKAVEYYTKTMGFPEAFRFVNASGQVQLVYVQVSKDTFVELQPANAQRPPGITHFGLHVENMAAATAMFKARGAAVGETTVSGTKAILSNIVDPNGVRAELAELPPDWPDPDFKAGPLLVCRALTGNSRQVEVSLRPGARKRQTGNAPSPADLCEAHLVATADKPIVATRQLGCFDKVPGNDGSARLGYLAAQGYDWRADDMARPCESREEFAPPADQFLALHRLRFT